MKLRKDNGQILPLVALLVFVLITFIGVNGERIWTGIQKVEQQKYADTLALTAANEQARALNAIAALNQGLRTTLQRTYIVSSVAAALAICALIPLGLPQCKTAWRTVAPKLIIFYKRVNKLAATYAGWQDAIIEWAEKAPGQAVLISNVMRESNGNIAVLYPRRNMDDAPISLSLLLERYSNETDLESLKECKEEKYDASRLGEVSRHSIHFGKDDELIIYRSTGDEHPRNRVIRYDIESWSKLPSTFDPIASSHEDDRMWHTTRVIFKRCKTFSSLMNDLSFLLPVEIPGPYVLKSEFQSEQRLLIGVLSQADFARLDNSLTKVTDDRNAFDTLLQNDPLDESWIPELRDVVGPSPRGASFLGKNIWSVAEAGIRGGNLMNMEFDAVLKEATHADALAADLNSVRDVIPPLLRKIIDRHVTDTHVFTEDEIHERLASSESDEDDE